MAKPSPAPFINHSSHNHKLELITDPTYATCTAVGSASSGMTYTCKPCSYSIHVECMGKEEEEEKKGFFHHRDRGLFHIHHHKKEEKEEKKEEKKEKEGKRAKVAAAISGFGVAGKMALKKMAHRHGGGGEGEKEEEEAEQEEEEEEEVEIEGEEEDGSLIETVLTFFSELEL